ncbi:MAG: S41 family peptidase, partial [Planctomycetota bacterium]
MKLALTLSLGLLFSPAASAQTDYMKDVESALEQVEEHCGALLKTKDISFKKLEKQFLKEAKKVKTDQDLFVLLVRLIARLEDGHAEVRNTELTEDIRWPEDESLFDPSIGRGDTGLAICRIGKKFYVKAVAGAARDAGVLPGSEILKMDGEKPENWLEAKIEVGRELISWSTDHQAFFWATHWGLSGPQGSRMKLEVKQPDGKKKKRTISISKSRVRMAGPAFWVDGLGGEGNVTEGMLPSGYGYIYLRRCKSDIAEEVEEALFKLRDAKGIILDFRGNSGGSFDHDD